MRVAVELGHERIRLAVADGPDEPPRLRPTGPLGRSPTAESAAHLVSAEVDRAGGLLDELVVVHPPHWTPAAVRAAAARLGGYAVRAYLCSAAPAAAREVAARTPPAPGPLAVLCVRPSGGHATVLPDPASATGRTHCVSDADPVAALSAAAVGVGARPYELTGGVLLLPETSDAAAELDELVERLTDLIGEPPLVLREADGVAVLGALRPAPGVPAAQLGVPASQRGVPGAGRGTAGAPPSTRPESTRAQSTRPRSTRPPPTRPLPVPAGELAAGLLPPPSPRRAGTGLAAPALAAAVAGVVTALLGGLLAGPPGAEPGSEPVVPAGRSVGTPGASGPVLLAQYDYTAVLPAGWHHTGGVPERRRSLITPAGAPHGADLISLEQTRLGYDSATERDRAVGELRARFEQARAAGARLDELTLSARFADRDLVTYRQRLPALGAEVDWYVLFDRDAQLSVGCQRTAKGAAAVAAACAEVVRSLRLRP